MRRFTPSREFYIPAGSTKVADKLSDAVAYIYANKSAVLCALVFVGKQAKPCGPFRFRSPADRERWVTGQFEGRRAALGRTAARKAERQAETHNLEVGHVLKSSWGYEQTNVNFYQVTKVISAKMVELREIASTRGEALTDMSGTVLPVLDKFTSKPMRKRASRHGVRMASFEFASVWDGRPAFESSWH